MLGVRKVEELVMEGSARVSGMKVLRLRGTLVAQGVGRMLGVRKVEELVIVGVELR
jgi:hypothetical protein